MKTSREIKFDKILGSRIRGKRKQLGYLQRELALSSKISRQAVVYIEKGKSSPTLYHLTLIAKKLREPVDYFTRNIGER